MHSARFVCILQRENLHWCLQKLDMGSNTSVVEVKQDKKGGFQVVSRDGKPIAAGGRKQGFKEVEIVYSDGAKASK